MLNKNKQESVFMFEDYNVFVCCYKKKPSMYIWVVKIDYI